MFASITRPVGQLFIAGMISPNLNFAKINNRATFPLYSSSFPPLLYSPFSDLQIFRESYSMNTVNGMNIICHVCKDHVSSMGVALKVLYCILVGLAQTLR